MTNRLYLVLVLIKEAGSVALPGRRVRSSNSPMGNRRHWQETWAFVRSQPASCIKVLDGSAWRCALITCMDEMCAGGKCVLLGPGALLDWLTCFVDWC